YAVGTISHNRSLTAVEALGVTGLDYIVLDMEHSPQTCAEVTGYITAAHSCGKDALVRVPGVTRAEVLHVLDVGADGVIIPCIEDISEVEELIGYAKFAPLGNRGYCMSRDGDWSFGPMYCEKGLPGYMEYANKNTILMPQCETVGCLEQIEKITALEGVDGIMVGPFDLSISMGIPGQFDNPEFKDALQHIADACNKNGKLPLIFSNSLDTLAMNYKQGYKALLYTLDIMRMINAFRTDLEYLEKGTKA
ncbi:MAG: hypothetical protein IKI65_05350, partial [Firmicutes bacterium]|nr:hypothetical protein [Bacillota bacterium]